MSDWLQSNGWSFGRASCIAGANRRHVARLSSESQDQLERCANMSLTEWSDMPQPFGSIFLHPARPDKHVALPSGTAESSSYPTTSSGHVLVADVLKSTWEYPQHPQARRSSQSLSIPAVAPTPQTPRSTLLPVSHPRPLHSKPHPLRPPLDLGSPPAPHHNLARHPINHDILLLPPL